MTSASNFPNQGKEWSIEDDVRLLNLADLHDKDWRAVAPKMGRKIIATSQRHYNLQAGMRLCAYLGHTRKIVDITAGIK